MPLIRLTQKLQKEMGLKPADFAKVQKDCVPFTEWYAHVFLLNRKKHIIFVEEQTLFTFSIGNISRKDICERLPKLFEKGLSKALFMEGASSQVMSKVMDTCRNELKLAKTESRKVIGAMNEFIKHYKFGFAYHCRSADALDRFNRYMPMRGFPNDTKDYQFPIDVFARVVKEQFDLNFTPQKEETFKNVFSQNIMLPIL